MGHDCGVVCSCDGKGAKISQRTRESTSRFAKLIYLTYVYHVFFYIHLLLIPLFLLAKIISINININNQRLDNPVVLIRCMHPHAFGVCMLNAEDCGEGAYIVSLDKFVPAGGS